MLHLPSNPNNPLGRWYAGLSRHQRNRLKQDLLAATTTNSLFDNFRQMIIKPLGLNLAHQTRIVLHQKWGITFDKHGVALSGASNIRSDVSQVISYLSLC